MLHTKDFWLTHDGRLEVYNAKLATKLNRFLKTYQLGRYKFRKGEEAIFRLLRADIADIVSRFLIRTPKISRTANKSLNHNAAKNPGQRSVRKNR